jgi:predicted metalloprotease
MRWDDFRKSSNVEDRRGQIVRAGGLGIGTMVILGLIAWGLGINPALLIGGAEMVSRHLPSSAQQGKPAGSDEAGQFVAAVLGDTEDQWSAIFRATGKTYQPPKLVMYSGATRSACGMAQAAVGPFYCPNDRTVYLDTAFFKQIETRLRGCEAGSKACQFSQAYVIAHEIGHHVQNQLGILPKVQALQARSGETEGNQLQVRVELQADCLAGVWANHSQNKWKFLEPGDIEAALQTATAIGDDTLQRRSQGYVVPDAFTHGSAEQRKRWLLTGLKSGDVTSCDTFGNTSL